MAKAKREFERGSLIRVVVPRTPRRKLGSGEREDYRRYIASFAQAPDIEVPGVGRGRAVEVIIPDWPERRRDKPKP